MSERVERALGSVLNRVAGRRERSTPAERLLLRLVLRRRKRVWATAEAALGDVQALRVRPRSYAPPDVLGRIADVSVREASGWPVYTLTPRGAAGGPRPAPGTAVYLHGGGFIHEVSNVHWSAVGELAARTGTTFVVPIYPLAPVGSASAVVQVATRLVGDLLDEAGAVNLTLMGDSAGGTIALQVAMALRDAGHPAPRRTILISPGLDLSYGNAAIPALDVTDPFLSREGLAAAARLWAGELPVEDPQVSPINGDLTGLGPIALFSGTNDILNPDARRLLALARDAGVEVEYHEVPGMFHVYPLLPVPEGKRARGIIADMLTRPGGAPDGACPGGLT